MLGSTVTVCRSPSVRLASCVPPSQRRGAPSRRDDRGGGGRRQRGAGDPRPGRLCGPGGGAEAAPAARAAPAAIPGPSAAAVPQASPALPAPSRPSPSPLRERAPFRPKAQVVHREHARRKSAAATRCHNSRCRRSASSSWASSVGGTWPMRRRKRSVATERICSACALESAARPVAAAGSST